MYSIPCPKLLARPAGWVFLGLLTAAWPLAAQRITDTSNGNLVGIVVFSSLTPAKATTVAPAQIQFRLRGNDSQGYHVDASASFTATTTSGVAGGTTIAASDIGVGITSITPAADVIVPRTDAILSGFCYDPTTVVASTGVTPYLGAPAGQATLADLSVNQRIVTGPQIASKTNNGAQDYLITVTMKFGLLPQYFTPGSFTATITMTISALP